MEEFNNLASFKIERFSENVRREVSHLMRNLKNLKENACNLSVARVEVLAGGRFFKIYVGSIKGIVDARNAIKCLKSASGFIKREISNKLKLRKCPDIEFVVDDYVVVHERLDKVLRSVGKIEKVAKERVDMI